jgi:2-succinyl-6-hydroxy-2,4-cyclohexadiene-1-carboxylate synthase
MSASTRLFVDAEGVRLRVVLDGPSGSNVPILLLHGFTGSSESMACVAGPLARTRRVGRIDLVGHGESDAPEELAAYSMQACVDQVLAVVDALGWEHPHLLGYSMGGRAALATAVARPERFASLILVGATAGIFEAEARRARVVADEALAARIERDGLEAFVDAWMALPLFASQKRLGTAALERARAERLRQRSHGLAQSLRGMGAGAQAPLFDRLDRVVAPVLLVAGEEDEKFQAIARALEVRLPDARRVVVPDAGHAAHLEAPIPFSRGVNAFLEEREPHGGAAVGVALEKGGPS